jgi:hypothetical protein
MRTAVRARVVANAEFHRRTANYFFGKAGVEPPGASTDKSQDEAQKPAADQQSATTEFQPGADNNGSSQTEEPREAGGRRSLSRRSGAEAPESVPNSAEQPQPEKSQEQLTAELHLSAAEQLEELAASAGASQPSGSQLPAELRRTVMRGSVPSTVRR